MDGRIALIKALSRPLLYQKKRKRWLLLGGSLLICLPFLSFWRGTSVPLIEEILARWEQGKVHDPVSFAEMEKKIAQSYAHRKRFSPRIAQQLLFFGQDELSTKYLQEAMRHTRDHLPVWYSHFSTIAYCIAKKHYSEALDLSRALQEEMDRHPTERARNSFLYLCNALRVVALEKELGMIEQGKKDLRELMKLAEYPEFRESFSRLDHYLREGEISIWHLE